MTLHDFTAELQSADRTWERGGRRFFAQFSQRAQETRVGLYVLIHQNQSPFAIYDRNGEGRLLVDAHSLGVKYGKFEHGFLSRRFEDHKHLHRKLDDESEESDIFASVLRYALVLDLSDIRLQPASPAAVFEPYWNAMLEAVLLRNGWVVPEQSARSESRRIGPGVTWQAVRDELLAAASDLDNRIRAAAEVLAQPS
jgi:hypothetical protein